MATRGIDANGGSAGQGNGVLAHGDDGQARDDRVAEAAAPSRPFHVHAVAGQHRVTRQQRSEPRELVRVVVAFEVRKIVRDLLHVEHVEIRQRPRVLDDARQVHEAVEAPPPLQVPGDELHGAIVQGDASQKIGDASRH
jgi:hypothetical protein